MDFLVFSFLQGLMAFLAPCAVAMLPAYIMAYISRGSATPSTGEKLKRGIKLAAFSILGILIIYGAASLMISLAGQLLKDYMKYVTLFMGVGLLILALLMFFGKQISFSLNFNEPNTQNEAKEAFYFGLAYAIGALGCLFPLFLVVTTQALAAENALLGVTYILAYFLGISSMMILVISLATFAKEFLVKNLRRVLPYMERLTAIMLFIAGLYIINYQLALF